MKEYSHDLVSYRLARAYEALEDATILANSGRWNACVSRLYYACFYAVTALLLTENLSSSKHTGVRGLFNQQFVKTGRISKDLARLYNDLFERRQEGDYIDFVMFEEAQVLPWTSGVREFLDVIADQSTKSHVNQ